MYIYIYINTLEVQARPKRALAGTVRRTAAKIQQSHTSPMLVAAELRHICCQLNHLAPANVFKNHRCAGSRHGTSSSQLCSTSGWLSDIRW